MPSIREWARANGYAVAEKGRIAPAIHAAYRREFGERERPLGAAQCGCGRTWTGLRECHCCVCHRHFSTVRWFDDHRAGMPRDKCHDPLTISESDGRPRFKIVENAWGELYVRATERPELSDDEEETLL